MKISREYRAMACMYRRFARAAYSDCDFSKQALMDAYEFESRGRGRLAGGVFENTNNGYPIGKKLVNISVAMWKEDIEAPGYPKVLTRHELSTWYPRWFLRKIIHA